ncbi:MAG: hypothetical protein AB7O24_00175 [Kofleriaceae bacterium]
MSARDLDQRSGGGSAPAADSSEQKSPGKQRLTHQPASGTSRGAGQAPGRGTLTGAISPRRAKPTEQPHAESHVEPQPDDNKLAGVLNGAPYEWVASSFQFRVEMRWLVSAPDFQLEGTTWAAPSRFGELLEVLRANGKLDWATPERIATASHQMRVAGSVDDVMVIELGTSALKWIGLPPGSHAVVERLGRGLGVTVAVPIVEANEGETFPLSRPSKQQMLLAIEQFTRLPVTSAARTKILDGELAAHMGAGAIHYELTEQECQLLFGQAAYDQWRERADETPGTGSFELVPGTDTSRDETAYVTQWLATHLPDRNTGGLPFVMSDQLAAVLHRIDAMGELGRASVLASLRARGHGDGLLTAEVFEAAAFEDEHANAEFDAVASRGSSLPPVFDYPIPARINQRNGLVVAGADVQLAIEVAWPSPKNAVEQAEFTLRLHEATIDWLFERTTPDGPVQERKHSAIDGRHDGHLDHKFALRPGEHEGIWTVHAFVRHNYFQPRHLITQVEVKTEQMRLAEGRGRAFNQLGKHRVDDADYNFDTSVHNELFGDREYDRGKRFRGDLPPGFAAQTSSQRKAAIDDDIAEATQTLQLLKGDKTDASVRAGTERHIAKLRATRDAIDNDVQHGWRPIEVRGMYLSRGRVDDRSLDLLGAVRTEYVELLGSQLKCQVSVQLRDVSRRFSSDNFTFTGSGNSYEEALELAFVDLCKKYPSGTVSILAEGFDQTGSISTGRTVGFELDTGSAWKTAKGIVFSPEAEAVLAAANVLAAVFPPLAAVVVPITIVHSMAKNLDALVDEVESGTLTGEKAALHMGQFLLDVMPVVGKARVFSTSRVAFRAFEISGYAGSLLMLPPQVADSIQTLRDNQINELIPLYSEYAELEKSTHESDPRLTKLRAEIERRSEDIRTTAQTEIVKAVVKTAAVMIPTAMANAYDKGVRSKKLLELVADGKARVADGVEAHYDRATRQIVASDLADRATLTRLEAEQAKHLTQSRGASVTQPTPAGETVRVRIRDRDGNPAGERIDVTYTPGPDAKPTSEAGAPARTER